jgi:hypothetical protein
MARGFPACAALIATTGLVACGGGNDSSGSSGSGGGAEPGSIDSQSAPLIAEAVAEAVVSGQNVSVIGEFSVPSPTTGLAGIGKDAPQTLAAAFGPETVPCDGGGTLTTSGTFAVPDSITVGDMLSFEFLDCDDGAGVVLDGRLGFEIVAFTGDVAMGMLTLTVSMNLDTLQFLENGTGGSMDGDLSFTIDTTNTPESFIAVSSSELTVALGAESTTLSEYIMNMTLDPTLGTVTLHSSATLSSSALAGTFSYVTTESLVFTGDGGPSAGRIVVTGAGGATMTITVLSAQQIELELDVDGNETIDEVIVTNWAELTA